MRTASLTALLLINFIFIIECAAQKASVDSTLYSTVIKPRYEFNAHTYNYIITCGPEIKPSLNDAIANTLTKTGLNYNNEKPDLTFAVNIDIIYQHDSVVENKSGAAAKQFQNSYGIAAEYNFRITNTENKELVSYNLNTIIKQGEIGNSAYPSRELAVSGAAVEISKNSLNLYSNLAKHISACCFNVLDTTIISHSSQCQLYWYSGKSRKYKYADLDTALVRIKKSVTLMNIAAPEDEFNPLLTQAKGIWLKAAKEFRDGAKDSRISVYNIAEIYQNLATVSFLLNDFAKAVEYLEKAKKYNIKSAKQSEFLKSCMATIQYNKVANEQFKKMELHIAQKLYSKVDTNNLVFAAIFDYYLNQNLRKSAYQLYYFPVNQRNFVSFEQTIIFESDPDIEKSKISFQNGLIKTLEQERTNKKPLNYEFIYSGKNICKVILNGESKYELKYNAKNQLYNISYSGENGNKTDWIVTYTAPDSINIQPVMFEKNKKVLCKLQKSYLKLNPDQTLKSRFIDTYKEKDISYTVQNNILKSYFDNPNLERHTWLEFTPKYRLDTDGNWIVMEIENGFSVKRTIK